MPSSNSPQIDVLLVEDDARLAGLTKDYLQGHGLMITIASTAAKGISEARARRFDVVLLDIMLPDGDGLEVCRSLREFTDIPVIMITARGEEADRVMGLEIGADDYVSKPFSPRELLARIRANVRRRRGHSGPSANSLEIGDLRVDHLRRSAVIGDRTLQLTGYEFSVLHALASNAGRVLSRDRLMELAKGSNEEAFDRSIDVHISHLRGKLGDEPKNPRWIKTVRGVGYLFSDGDTE